MCTMKTTGKISISPDKTFDCAIIAPPDVVVSRIVVSLPANSTGEEPIDDHTVPAEKPPSDTAFGPEQDAQVAASPREARYEISFEQQRHPCKTLLTLGLLLLLALWILKDCPLDLSIYCLKVDCSLKQKTTSTKES